MNEINREILIIVKYMEYITLNREDVDNIDELMDVTDILAVIHDSIVDKKEIQKLEYIYSLEQ